jgi:hypothetical protein
MTFHQQVNEASERGSIAAKANEACDALLVVASPNLILNISDGHKHGSLSINEDDDPVMMEAVRLFAQGNYTNAMSKLREVMTDG